MTSKHRLTRTRASSEYPAVETVFRSQASQPAHCPLQPRFRNGPILHPARPLAPRQIWQPLRRASKGVLPSLCGNCQGLQDESADQGLHIDIGLRHALQHHRGHRTAGSDHRIAHIHSDHRHPAAHRSEQHYQQAHIPVRQLMQDHTDAQSAVGILRQVRKISYRSQFCMEYHTRMLLVRTSRLTKTEAEVYFL